MEIKFVTDDVVAAIRGKNRNSKYDWLGVVDAVRANPGRWAEVPWKIGNANMKSHLHKRYESLEIRLTGGNNLPLAHPDKKLWTMYIRYVPEES